MFCYSAYTGIRIDGIVQKRIHPELTSAELRFIALSRSVLTDTASLNGLGLFLFFSHEAKREAPSVGQNRICQRRSF